MEYAFINGIRSLPKKGAIATCTGCQSKMIAKCGNINVHHWAHSNKVECDPWWENETQWHRDWKNLFPEEYREIVLFDSENLEYHRADVYTKSGVTIEFQNSPLSIAELESRERFYEKLVWVLNGQKFKGFKSSTFIPDPNDPALNGFEIYGNLDPDYYPSDQRFWPKRMRDVYSLRRPHINSIRMSPWHEGFLWKNAHKVWLQATCPVLVDFGGHFLYLIKRRRQLTEDFLYVKKIPKTEFISRYLPKQ